MSDFKGLGDSEHCAGVSIGGSAGRFGTSTALERGRITDARWRTLADEQLDLLAGGFASEPLNTDLKASNDPLPRDCSRELSRRSVRV